MACVLLDAVLTQVLSTLTPMRRHIDWVGWVGGSYVGVDEWLHSWRQGALVRNEIFQAYCHFYSGKNYIHNTLPIINPAPAAPGPIDIG